MRPLEGGGQGGLLVSGDVTHEVRRPRPKSDGHSRLRDLSGALQVLPRESPVPLEVIAFFRTPFGTLLMRPRRPSRIEGVLSVRPSGRQPGQHLVHKVLRSQQLRLQNSF